MLKLHFCKVADVFDRDRQFLFTANVTILDSGQAQLTFPSEADIEDMEVEGYVTFYDDVEGLVTFWCSFYDMDQHFTKDTMTMTTSAVDMVDQVQRRQDLKTSLRFKMEVDYTDAKGNLRFCKAEVENISAGGVFFTSEHKFALGDSVVLRLSEIASRLHAKTQILRIQALDDWESSPWLIREAPPPPPPKPVATVEGQNIFAFKKSRKKQKDYLEEIQEEIKDQLSGELKDQLSDSLLQEDLENEEELTRFEDVEQGGNATRFGYGCKFRKIGQINEIAIRRFVFDQERLRLQRTRQDRANRAAWEGD